ncbi:hypothetical protein RRG08_022817 [Elysia crispata]|uniref:Uncharacterized protein n=1 Tax=Elysia crispata TaxID=231223 RepID=A0AAE1D7T9_9GAST|nr:hypothetical protein RRG08_022817 [Elysia crispata]
MNTVKGGPVSVITQTLSPRFVATRDTSRGVRGGAQGGEKATRTANHSSRLQLSLMGFRPRLPPHGTAFLISAVRIYF